MDLWITDAAKELVETMRYAQKWQTHYHDAEEIEGFAMVIKKHYEQAQQAQGEGEGE